MYRKFFKRVFDVVSSGAVILTLLPFFIIFTPIVAIAMKGNPFFVQERAGLDGKPFHLLKYRTMSNAKDENGELLTNEKRLTKFGKLIRALSLDELPQLFNIFIGKMSVVGPRPLYMKYIERYNDFQSQRLLAKPGLTGLAQIEGRNAIEWENKFNLDVKYVNNITFLGDMKIIFKTITKVIKRDGISQGQNAYTPEFKGTKEEIGEGENEKS